MPETSLRCRRADDTLRTLGTDHQSMPGALELPRRGREATRVRDARCRSPRPSSRRTRASASAKSRLDDITGTSSRSRPGVASGVCCVRDPHAADLVAGGLVLGEPACRAGQPSARLRRRAPWSWPRRACARGAGPRARACARRAGRRGPAGKPSRGRGATRRSERQRDHRHDGEHAERRDDDASVLLRAVTDDHRAPRLVHLQRDPPHDRQDQPERGVGGARDRRPAVAAVEPKRTT